jgi:hypothetical protein
MAVAALWPGLVHRGVELRQTGGPFASRAGHCQDDSFAPIGGLRHRLSLGGGQHEFRTGGGFQWGWGQSGVLLLVLVAASAP